MIVSAIPKKLAIPDIKIVNKSIAVIAAISIENTILMIWVVLMLLR